MNGASTAIGAAGSVYPPNNQDRSHASKQDHPSRYKVAGSEKSGVLTSVEQALSQSLGAAGFVDLTDSFSENFRRRLRSLPREAEMEDLKPGVLEDLLAWTRSQITGRGRLALAAQARISSEAAVRLLM